MPKTVVPGEKSTDKKETSAVQTTPTPTPSGQAQSNIVQSSPTKNSQTGVQDFSPKETVPSTPSVTPQTPQTPSVATPDTNNVHTYNGKPLVGARDYINQSGYGDMVEWDDKSKRATIGGINIPYKYNADGTIYSTKEDLDDVISQYKKSNGIDGNKQVVDNYDKEWGPMLKGALNEILGREEFDYDTDNDELYSVYSDAYKKNADHAMRRVLNDNNSSISGANSAVASMAMAAHNEQMNNLNNIIPELEERAHDRYKTENDLDLKTLEALGLMSDSDYNKDYTANRDQIHDTQYANEQETKREQQEFDNGITFEMLPHEIQGMILSNEAQSIANGQAVIDNAFANATTRGFFTKEDEKAIPWLKEWYEEHGEYPSPWMAQLVYEKDMGKVQADIKNGIY